MSLPVMKGFFTTNYALALVLVYKLKSLYIQMNIEKLKEEKIRTEREKKVLMQKKGKK
jgi:hypothetical protein